MSRGTVVGDESVARGPLIRRRIDAMSKRVLTLLRGKESIGQFLNFKYMVEVF